jgi:hypothetical protein
VNRELGRPAQAAEQLTRAVPRLEHLTTALQLNQAALALAREIGDRRIEADPRNTLGGVRLQLGCPEEAAGHHRQALDLARQTGARYPEIEALLGLSRPHSWALAALIEPSSMPSGRCRSTAPPGTASARPVRWSPSATPSGGPTRPARS